MLKVTKVDLEKLGQCIDEAVVAGANRVGGVYFTFSRDKLVELNTLARQRAVEDARAKAETIANSLEVKIVRVAGAVEQTITPRQVAVPVPAPAPAIIPPAELEISVMVEVTYIIE